MFYNILDSKRIQILPKLKNFKEDFYLAGGTALALQLGHRDSVDFDFFSEKNINTQEIFEELKESFVGFEIVKTLEDKDTLNVVIDNNIKLSFFSYKYKLLNELLEEEFLNLASVEDVACMKLSAITGRASEKDYVDLYFILKQINLKSLLEKVMQKFPNLDTNLILKSLVYFEDIEEEPILFKNKNNVSLEEIKNFLKNKIRDL